MKGRAILEDTGVEEKIIFTSFFKKFGKKWIGFVCECEVCLSAPSRVEWRDLVNAKINF
jgi:hypothetical protein